MTQKDRSWTTLDNSESIGKQLGELLRLIRFLIMNIGEFFLVAEDEVLTADGRYADGVLSI